MASDRRERKRRKSTARRRAEEHQSGGFSGTMLNLPDGLRFWSPEKGMRRVDIVPYTVKKGSDVPGGNPFAEKGDLHYERTFYKYRKIGADEKDYIAPGKTFGEPDFIAEWRRAEARKSTADEALIRELEPKERQLFLVWDHDHKDEGIQLWEFSSFCFGNLLDSRIKNSREEDYWDEFYYPDADGLTLQITFEDKPGKGFKFLNASAIDFIPRRDALPDEIANHEYNLDDMLVRVPYEKLKSIFLQIPEDGDGEPADEQEEQPRSGVQEEQPRSGVLDRRRQRRERPDPEPEDEPPAKQEKPKQETKQLTAKEAGITTGCRVLHPDHGVCEVFKISEDGTSLTLVDADDSIHKAVGCDEVKVKKGGKAPEPPEDEEEGGGSEEPDWNEDW